MPPSTIQRLLLSLWLPVFLLVLWECAVRYNLVPQVLVASPTQVFINLIYWLPQNEFWHHVFISLTRLMCGFIIGVVSGITLGSLTGSSQKLAWIFNPTIKMLSPIPPIAWIPFFIMFFGIGEGAKIALIALASFLIVFLNTFQGIRAVDIQTVEVAKALKKSHFILFWHVLLPAAMTQIMVGIRVALGIAWILLVAAELIASSGRLGWFLWDARNFSRPDDMIVSMIALGALGAGSDRLLTLIEKRILFWGRNFNGH